MAPLARVVSLGLALVLGGRASAQNGACEVAPPPVPGAGIPSAAGLAPGDTIPVTFAAFYTPEAADSALGRGRPITEWIADAFAAWQPVLDSASAPGPRVLAVPLGPHRLELAETGACFSDLDAFRAHPRAQAVRDSLEANVAVLFTARCSAAYQCSPEADCEAAAYVTARFPVAGATTPEGGHALAHEVGHALGMRHDVGDDPTPGYNHGHRDETGGFFTMLALRGPLPRTAQAPFYSDPRRTRNGRPLGVAGLADNARVLREAAPAVAEWNEGGTPVEPGPLAAALALSAAPNPARGAWMVRVEVPAAGAVRLVLYDATGRAVWSAARPVAAGAAAVRVPAGRLAPGAYLLRATWEGPEGTRTGRLALTRR